MTKNDKIPVETLSDITGGLYTREEKILFAMVKCPVEGCGYECKTFGALNRHMRECHEDYLRRY